jgi:hypothetical protein
MAISAVAALSLLVGAGAVLAAEVDTLPGEGWAVSPDQTSGGSARLVEGPATPPAGRGSLELGVDAQSDRALVVNPVDSIPLVSPDRVIAALSGSWATYVPTGTTEFAAPVLRIAGFLVPAAPMGTFTTLSVEPYRQGTVADGTWQTWTLGPASVVWQTNTVDGFCVQSSPCTFAQFAAQYPAAAWFTLQLGIGSGVPGPVVGYADDVDLTAGTSSLVYDFEIPAAQRSTAAIGTAHLAGGTWMVPVTLTASPLAVAPVEFTVVGPTTTTFMVEPGATVTVELAVPLGTTPISASAQGTTLASASVTVPPPTTTTTSTTTTSTTAPTTTTSTTTTSTSTTTTSTTAPSTTTTTTAVTTTSLPGSTSTAPASTTSPAPHPTLAHHPASGAGRRLPATGGPTGVLAVVGVALVALGVLLAAAAARRRTAA